MAFNIAAYIDHTILKPEATVNDIKNLCEEAITCRFAAVCVPPYYIRKAVSFLQGSSIKVATVIGFPFGYSHKDAKLEEARKAIDDGADELDIVHNIAALKSGDTDYLVNEAAALIGLVHKEGRIAKVIIESGILTDEEIISCCKIYVDLGADFVKTSTGYATAGASVHAVRLMRQHLPADIAIKASGGIRNFEFAKALIDAGVTRIGCSASVQITKEAV